MKTKQPAKGFTATELIISIAAAATLTTIATSTYLGYLADTQTREGIDLILASGQNIGSITSQKSCTPTDIASSNFGSLGTLKLAGSYSAKSGKTCRTGCSATYTFGEGVLSSLKSKKITVDILNSGEVSLDTVNTTVDQELLNTALLVIPVSSSDTCAAPVNDIPLNQSITEASPVDSSTLQFGHSTRMQSSPAYDNTPSTLDPLTTNYNVDLSQPQTFLFKLIDNGNPNIPQSLSSVSTTQFIQIYNKNSSNLKGDGTYKMTAVLSDRSIVDFGVAQVLYRDKRNHLIRTLYLTTGRNPTFTAAYPSVTVSVLKKDISAPSGFTGTSFKLKYIEETRVTGDPGRYYIVDSADFYYGVQDLGELPTPMPAVAAAMSTNLTNNLEAGQYTGYMKLQFNKD